jgi:hypothetical protein
MVIFGIFNAFTGFLVMGLRETRGKKLLDYIGQEIVDEGSSITTLSDIY